MPLFFFVSGLFSKNAEKCRKNAFFDLLIPYLLFQGFYALVQYVLFQNQNYIFNPFFPAPALWYLLALFVFRFVLQDVIKIKGNLIIALLMSVFGICIIGLSHEFAMNRIFANFIYFLLGYYADPQMIITFKETVFKKFAGKAIFYFGSILVSSFAFAAIYFILKSRVITFADLLGLIGRSKNVSNVGIRLLYGPFISTVGVIATCIFSTILISITPKRKSWLTVVGENTLPLYLSHMLIQLLYGIIQKRYFFFESWTINYLLSFIPVAICAYVFSTTWYRKFFNKLLSGVKKLLIKQI